MQVIEKHPIPIYQISCPECKSVLRYKASEVCNLHITCPVCGVSMWAEGILPINMDENEDEVC